MGGANASCEPEEGGASAGRAPNSRDIYLCQAAGSETGEEARWEGAGEVGCARAVRPDWATFSGAGSTMFSRAGVAGVSAWAVQPQWYGSLRSGRERCEGRRSSVRGKRRRVEATETNRGRGLAGPPVPRRPQEAPRPREGARSDCRDRSHATSPEAREGGVRATRTGHLGPRDGDLGLN